MGYKDGQANPGMNCPSGHSDNFCARWEAGASRGGYMLGNSAGWKEADNDFWNLYTPTNNHCPGQDTSKYCEGFHDGYKSQWNNDMETENPCYTLGHPPPAANGQASLNIREEILAGGIRR